MAQINVVAYTSGSLRDTANSCGRAADLEMDAIEHDLTIVWETEDDGYIPFRIEGTEAEMAAFMERNKEHGPFDTEEY